MFNVCWKLDHVGFFIPIAFMPACMQALEAVPDGAQESTSKRDVQIAEACVSSIGVQISFSALCLDVIRHVGVVGSMDKPFYRLSTPLRILRIKEFRRKL